MGFLPSDVRYSYRRVFRRPSVTTTVVLSLALTIGANSAVFSALRSVLFRPLSFPQFSRLVFLFETDASRTGARGLVSYPNFEDWHNQASAFEGMAALSARGFTLEEGNQTSRIQGELVTADYFPLLGVRPLIGRVFLPNEHAADASPVCVVSYNLWQSAFGADPTLVGRPLRLGGHAFTVIGILTKGFRGFSGDSEVWLPLIWQPMLMPANLLRLRGSHWLTVIARLNDGVSHAQAQAAMASLGAQIANTFPREQRNRNVVIVPAGEELFGSQNVRSTVLLTVMVVIVLVIACANVTNVLLIEAAGRQKENSIRLAIGAQRLHLIREQIIYSVLLSMMGGAVGLVVAMAGIEWFNVAQYGLNIELDRPVILFNFAVSFFAGCGCGVLPALRASHQSLNETLKTGTAMASAPNQGSAEYLFYRVHNCIVVAEFAIALTLLIGAGLIVRSFALLSRIDPGFELEQLLTLRLDLSAAQYTPGQTIAVSRQLIETLDRLPGVQSVSLTSDFPLSGARSTTNFTIVSASNTPPDKEPMAFYCIVSERFFETLRTPLLRGRSFSSHDDAIAPRVIIINDAMARLYWGAEDPIGKVIRISRPDGFWNASVIGVAKDIRYRWQESPTPLMYWSALQAGVPSPALILRSAVEPKSLSATIQQTLRRVSPGIAAYDLKLMEGRVQDWLSNSTFTARLVTMLSVVALTLALVGAYGVLAEAVNRRTREIGIRMALGARKEAIFRLLLKNGLTLVAIGVFLGLLISLVATRFVAGILYGITALDPTTFVGVVVLLAATGFVACYIPARRATSVDPLVALHYE